MSLRYPREHKRAFGFRRPGTWWLAGGRLLLRCGRLPLVMTPCQKCGTVWCYPSMTKTQWVDPRQFVNDQPCHMARSELCEHGCMFRGDPTPTRAAIVWLPSYYETAANWISECEQQGALLQIYFFNKKAEMGVTPFYVIWHPSRRNLDGCPQIFAGWRPERLEYIPLADDNQLRLGSLRAQGIDLVEPIRIEDTVTK